MAKMKLAAWRCVAALMLIPGWAWPASALLAAWLVAV
jgi:hypothetical protein